MNGIIKMFPEQRKRVYLTVSSCNWDVINCDVALFSSSHRSIEYNETSRTENITEKLNLDTNNEFIKTGKCNIFLGRILQVFLRNPNKICQWKVTYLVGMLTWTAVHDWICKVTPILSTIQKIITEEFAQHSVFHNDSITQAFVLLFLHLLG